jgi:peptidoglycan hydrolase CwlO-like protein
MRTKEEIQGEIDKVKGFIESCQKELETRKNQFDKDVIRASIFWWNIRIEELKKELNNQPKTFKTK